MPNTARNQTYQLQLLKAIGACRWASKRTLVLYPTNDRCRQRTIKHMQDEGYISFKPMERGRRYRLTEKGANRLFDLNHKRYRHIHKEHITGNDFNKFWVKRVSHIGEAFIMSELAGYASHPDDKPASEILLTQNRAGDGKQNRVNNLTTHRYHSEDERLGGNLELDTSPYKKRITPTGCFYTIRELKSLAELEAKRSGGNVRDIDNIKYTKLSGLLFTGEGGWRIYNTETTAPTFRPSGEIAMLMRLSIWCGNVYGTSLQKDSAYRAEFLRGSILMGDKSHEAAVGVIGYTNHTVLDPQLRRRAGNVTDSSHFNLKDIGIVYFLPVIHEAIPLYSCMLYEKWESSLRSGGHSVLRARHLLKKSVALSHTGIYDGELESGYKYACIIPLNLNRVMRIIEDLENSDMPGVHIQCMEWQGSFIERLKARMDIKAADKISTEYAPQELLERGLINLRRHYE